MLRAKSATKPAKPYKEFPLFAHPNGQWCKKIHGKPWYFGRWEDPDAALKKYLDEVDEIKAGRDPRRLGVADAAAETITVVDVVNLFLGAMDDKCRVGDISQRHFADYRRSCAVIVKHFGRRVQVGSLRAADFAALRKSFPDTWGPTKVGTEIQRMRTAFRWAVESEVIAGLPNFGPDFKKPQKSVVRRAKADRESKHGKLMFSREELRTILDASDGWLKACILLGVNAGFGAADCGRLRTRNVESEWYDLPRAKTAIPRRFRIWDETLIAVKQAILQRPMAADDAHDDLCFLTSHGKPVWWETESGAKCDNVGKMFLKLLKKLDADHEIEHDSFVRPGRGYYSLRRTYETVAGNSKDQVAVNYAMGHVDDSMAAVYRQGIDDQRLIDVAEHVREWLFGGSK